MTSENSGYFYRAEILTKRIFEIEELWQDLMFNVKIKLLPHMETLAIDLWYAYPDIIEKKCYDKIYRGIKCPATDEGIEQYIEIIKPIFENYIFTTSEKFNDIREIDNYVNSTIEISQEIFGFLGGQDGALYRKIIIARLADNPLYNDIINYYRGNFTKVLQNPQNIKLERVELYKKRFEVFEEVVRRLENVAPLENPVFT